MSASDIDKTALDLDQIMVQARKDKGIRKERKKSGDRVAVDVTFRSPYIDDIQATISATPQAWQSLYENFDPDHDEDMTLLGRLIWLNAIRPAWWNTPDKRSRLDPYTPISEKYVAAAWVLINQWLACDPRPEPLESIVNRCRKSGANIYDDREAKGPLDPTVTISPIKVVYFLWKEAFGNKFKEINRKGPNNLKSFQSQFVQKNPYRQQAQHILERFSSPLTIKQLSDHLI